MARSVGTPTWIDFGTNDMATTRAFYEQLFGWEFEDSGPEMGHYLMIRKDGTLVGGGMDTSGMTCPEGQPLPASWTIYLAVDDVDARVAKAEAAGATVVVPAGDAGPAGRFAVVLDPTGAAVGLWQAGDTEGYEFTGQPGTPLWFEVLTQDLDASAAFYREVFDFDPTPMDTPMDDGGNAATYLTNGPEAEATSGLCDVSGFVPAEEGSWWRVYLGVADCDAAVARVQELGGTLKDGPFDSPFGRIATVAEPTGGDFQLCAPSQAVTEGDA